MRILGFLLLTALLTLWPCLHVPGQEDTGAVEEEGLEKARTLYQEVGRLRGELEEGQNELNELQEEFVGADQKRQQEIEVQGRLKQAALETISSDLIEKQKELYEAATALLESGMDNPEVRIMRCEAAFAAMKYDVVVEDAARIPEEKRKSLDMLMITGQSLEKLARFPEAIVRYREALKQIPPERESFVRFSLANCYFNAHQFAQAFEEFTTLAKAAPAPAKRQFDHYCRTAAEYVKLLEQEQDIRQREAEQDTNPVVILVLSGGEVKVELFEGAAPNTVANFITLVEDHFYDGLPFYKVMAHMLAQTGCPMGTGEGGPGYRIADEFRKAGARRHFAGSLSMVNNGTPDNNGSQFMITSVVSFWLNGKQTVFGRVLEGQEVVRNIRQGDRIISARVVRKRDHPYQVVKLP